MNEDNAVDSGDDVFIVEPEELDEVLIVEDVETKAHALQNLVTIEIDALEQVQTSVENDLPEMQEIAFLQIAA